MRGKSAGSQITPHPICAAADTGGGGLVEVCTEAGSQPDTGVQGAGPSHLEIRGRKTGMP